MTSNPLEGLVGKRVEVLDKGWIELVDLLPHPSTGVSGDLAIVNAARVSFMGESKGPEKDKKLLFYLLRNHHTSPFEMVEFKFRVRAPLVTWWQWVRHRTWNFNAQCLDGDTLVTFNLPYAERTQGVLKPYYMKLGDLYSKWHSNKRNQYPLEKMRIRVLNEATGFFESAQIKNVWKTEKKPAFKITTKEGYSVICSAEHEFKFEDGWKTLGKATGLEVINNQAVWQHLPKLYVNGEPLPSAELYTNKDWLFQQYTQNGLSIKQIAELASCSYHTIRKYLTLHNLTDKNRSKDARFKQNNVPWNVGKHYSFNFTEEQRQRWSEKSTKYGARASDHIWWRGGVSSERALIGTWTTQHSKDIFKRDNYKCAYCGGQSTSQDRFQCHHIIPIWADTELKHAYDLNNLITVHQSCHKKIHKHNQELQFAQCISQDILFEPKLKTEYIKKIAAHSRLVPKLNTISKIEYLGEREMYDITVKGSHHNYVANGIVVHNSGRYTPFEENDFYVPDIWRKQAASNKQASEGQVEDEVNQDLTDKLNEFYKKGYDLYEEALKAGVSKEMARLFLPGFSVYYTWVAKVDAHNLMQFLRLRMASDAQYEIRVYAQAIYDEFFKVALPWTAEAFEEYSLKSPPK